MITDQQLNNLIEGDIVLVKVEGEYFPIEIKHIVNKSLSKYIVGIDGAAYSLNELFMEEALTQ